MLLAATRAARSEVTIMKRMLMVVVVLGVGGVGVGLEVQGIDISKSERVEVKSQGEAGTLVQDNDLKKECTREAKRKAKKMGKKRAKRGVASPPPEGQGNPIIITD